LRTPEVTARATKFAVGINLPRLSPSVLASFPIPLPPLPEQRRIADILDRADALHAKRRAALAQLYALSESIFLDMFVEGQDASWEQQTIDDLAAPVKGAIRTGPFGSQLLHSEFTEEGVAVLGIDNAVHNEFRWAGRRYISPRKYEQLNRYTVRPGDVLITIMGTCGRCAVVPRDIGVAINTKHLCCISLNHERCLPEFLHSYFLLHPIAQKYLSDRAKGAIMAGLNMGIVKTMPVTLPPIGMQAAYVRLAAEVERMKQLHSDVLSGLTKLFDSLRHRAFHGEL
jgi:type I restriction enzyme S subunit